MNSRYKRLCGWLFGCSLSAVLSVSSLLFPVSANAWNATGHMVVAAIAYEQLNPTAREKVDQMVASLNKEYADMRTFMDIAYWPDAIRGQKIETYTHWHYVNLPYVVDDTTPKYVNDTDNAVWAVKRIRNVVANDSANPYERARFLSFLVHITGDLHQPLHSVSYVSKMHPYGDKGGNSYKVRYHNRSTKLHTLWDKGVTAFDYTGHSVERAKELASAIMQRYPKSSFSKRAVTDVNPDDWSKDGLSAAKKYVYTVKEDAVPSTSYVQKGTTAAEKQAALGGYRLGNLLNTLLS